MTDPSNYCFNVVATDSRSGTPPVAWHRQPSPFAGTADEFAQAMLDDVMSGDPRLAGEWVTVKVWDGARPGGFSASLSFVSDPAFAGMTVEQVAALTTASYRTFFADHADPDGVFRGFPGEHR